MAVRTTVDIPDLLHARLRERAARSGSSIRSLIIGALERSYADSNKGKSVSGPLLRTRGKLGPDFPVDQNPHEHVFS